MSLFTYMPVAAYLAPPLGIPDRAIPTKRGASMQSGHLIPARKRRLTNAWRLGLLIVLALSGVLFDAPKPAYAASFTVNSPADAVDAIPGNGACASAAGDCTLRAAIQEANALPGADTITLPSGI